MDHARLIDESAALFQKAVKALAETDGRHLTGALIKVLKATDESLNQLLSRRNFKHVFAPVVCLPFSAPTRRRHSQSGYNDRLDG